MAKQKEVLTELEKESAAISENDLSKENDTLKAALEKLQAEHTFAEKRLKILAEQNAELKNSLYEHIYNEKLTIIKMSEARLNVFFRSNVEGEINRLDAFEEDVKSRISYMSSVLSQHNIDSSDEIYKKLEDLSSLLDQKVTEARARLAKTTGVFSENEKSEFEALKNEQITEREIIESAKRNNFEAFIGLNLINKLGILLIIIGVIAASQFVYKQMPDFVKSIMMFSLGGAMMIAGELMNRKKANVFSLGITAGGVGVLYAAIVTSSLVLKLGLFTASIYPALFTIILITAIAFFLSLRYNAQTIAAFALIGGYLPIFKVTGSLTLLYYAMVYFVLLNLFALLISLNKKWPVSSFVGLVLNMAGTVYIYISISDIIHPWDAPALKFGFPQIATILYIIFAFIIYTLIPVFGTYFKKSAFKKPDVILFGINTFFSSVLMIIVFYDYNLEKFLGLLAFGFAGVYLLIGLFIKIKFKHEKSVQDLFFITGFVFIILIVPFQFERIWFSLGWLVEGTALTVYGILSNKKAFKTCGYIIDGICAGSFLVSDVLIGYSGIMAPVYKFDLFAYKYALITLGSFIILGAYIYKKTLSGKFQTIYKYAAVINLWGFAVYLSYKLLNDVFFDRLIALHYSPPYLAGALAATLIFLIACAAPRIKILTDSGMRIISMVMYAFGTLWLFILNATDSPSYYYLSNIYYDVGGNKITVDFNVRVVGTLILLAVGFMSVFALMDFMKILVMQKKLGVEWYPLLVSAYLVIILSQNLLVQYSVDFSNFVLSIIYMLTAMFWIILGFIKRYKFIRIFGLGLSFLSVIKLFVIDLSSLTQTFRIISYFALGIILLAISFVYQHFSKRLELKETAFKDLNS